MNFLFNYADTYGSLIPLIALLIVFYRKKFPAFVIPLAIYFIVSIILFGYSNYLADQRINNLLYYNIFSVVELVLITWLFREIFRNRSQDYIFFLVVLFFVSFSIFNGLYLEDFSSLNSNMIAIEFLVIIIYCFVYFIDFSKTGDIINFYRVPKFWIVSGLFVYFSICIMVVVGYKYAAQGNQDFILDFWMLQVIMYLIKNILITKGILCFKTSK